MTLRQGVFNVTDNTYSFQVLPSNTPTLNKTNLRGWVNLLLDSTGPTGGHGGTLQFPSIGKYRFDGSITVGPGSASHSPSILFMGTGLGSLSVPILEMVDNSDDLFVVNNASSLNHDIGGVLFQDLQIAYEKKLTHGSAIRVSNHPTTGTGSQNVRIFRMVFQDCPNGVVFQNTLQGLVEQCTFIFEHHTDNVTAITIDTAQPANKGTACNEILVKKCDIRTKKSDNTGTGVAIYACMHATLENVTIAGLDTGILLSPTAEPQNNTSLTTIFDCNVGSHSAGLKLLPKSSTGSGLREVRVHGSSFTQSTETTYTGPGIEIALPSGGSNGQVDTVKLIGVTSQGWKGHGLQISGGQNIQVIGGTYAGNGTGHAGIAITGTARNISMVGVDQPATYPGTTAQKAALHVGGNPTSVLSKDCTMLGYSGSPLDVTGSPPLLVINAAGYNDVNTRLNGGSAPTSPTSASTTITPYFGPSSVNFAHSKELKVHISGKGYMMKFGSLYLPRPLDSIYFEPEKPSDFMWLGK